MSTGAMIGAIMLAASFGFMVGAWWGSRIRDEIMQSMEDDIQASTDRMLDRGDKH